MCVPKICSEWGDEKKLGYSNGSFSVFTVENRDHVLASSIRQMARNNITQRNTQAKRITTSHKSFVCRTKWSVVQKVGKGCPFLLSLPAGNLHRNVAKAEWKMNLTLLSCYSKLVGIVHVFVSGRWVSNSSVCILHKGKIKCQMLYRQISGRESKLWRLIKYGVLLTRKPWMHYYPALVLKGCSGKCD